MRTLGCLIFILFLGVSCAAADSERVFELRSGSYDPEAGFIRASIGGSSRPFYLASNPLVTEADVQWAHVEPATDSAEVLIQLREAGKRTLSDYTARNLNRPLAILAYGEVVTAPVVREKIENGQVGVNLGSRARAVKWAGKLNVRTEPER